jgi:signal transduction histidine kinase/ActR/RegA family two-component response regulator
VRIYGLDITERKRSESRLQRETAYKDFLLLLHEKAPSLSDKELYDYVLEEMVRLTDSAIGFFHRVSDDQKTVVLTTWNSEALKNCAAAYETHYLLEQAGNWVDCVRFGRQIIYNDFPHAPNQKGLPDGHVPVRRFMSIPVMEEDKVRAIFGVGNKAEEYDESDALQIQLVANALHAIMKGRRAETALRKAHDELELRVQERTAELSEAYEALRRETEERRHAEEQLRQAQKMEAVGTLAGGIAHDFNNILAAIIGFTEMVIDDVSDKPFVQQRMERVLKAGFRGRDLVRQILAFSRKSEGERKQVSLTSLVQETHALLRSSLPTTIQMPLAITTSDDYVLADPTQLQQVLMNLVTNAAYAMRDDGGQLTIGVSSVTFPRGSLLPNPDMEPGSYVKVTVKDTGTGMTEEVRERIFEPFFTTKENGKGTGMGLAVVYGIVKSHGGAVTVQSEVGQGSTFAVFLPRAQKPEVTKEEKTTSTLPTGTERILFVDDEELLVEMARDMLESLGYHVTAAKHPTDAWKLFLEDPSQFDLVITDQTMPDTTGVVLAQKMLRVRKEMPIILCTGYSEMVSADKAKEVGIHEFVMKPMAKKELAETIRRALDGRKE